MNFAIAALISPYRSQPHIFARRLWVEVFAVFIYLDKSDRLAL
jgi:hypothetical protein